MIGLIALIALLAVLGLYWFGIHRGLVALHEDVEIAWANVDAPLRQRHEELPKLVETCRRSMQFEQQMLARVMRARASIGEALAAANVAAVGAAEQQLRAAMRRLFAVAENYPQLMSDARFITLQSRITALDALIAQRRELYNQRANLINIRVLLLADRLMARCCGFKHAQLLEFSADECQAARRPLQAETAAAAPPPHGPGR